MSSNTYLDLTAKSIPSIKTLCEDLGFFESLDVTKSFRESCRAWTDTYRTSSGSSGKELTEWKATATKQEIHSMSLDYLKAHGHEFWPPVVSNLYHYPADTDHLVILLCQLFYRFNSNRLRYERYGPFRKSLESDRSWWDPERSVSIQDESLSTQSSGFVQHIAESEDTEPENSQNTGQIQGAATLFKTKSPPSDGPPTSSYNLRGRHYNKSRIDPRILGEDHSDVNPSPPSQAHVQNQKSLFVTLRAPQLAGLLARPRVSAKRLPTMDNKPDNTSLTHDHPSKRSRFDFQSSSSLRSSLPCTGSGATDPSEVQELLSSFMSDRRTFGQSSELQPGTKAAQEKESAPLPIATNNSPPQRHVPEDVRLTVSENPFRPYIAPIAPMTRDQPRALQPLSPDITRASSSMPPDGSAPSSKGDDLDISDSNKRRGIPSHTINVIFWIIKARVPRLRRFQWTEGKFGGKPLQALIDSISQIVESDQIEKIHCTLKTWKEEIEVTVKKGDEVGFEGLKSKYNKAMREDLDENTKRREDFEIWIEPILVGQSLPSGLTTNFQAKLPDW